jgi:hypothetical protein
VARAADRACFCLSRSALKALRHRQAPRQPSLACGPVPSLSRTASAALRYWNMARQRYYRFLPRCCRALSVSADRAARPGPRHPRIIYVRGDRTISYA